MFKDLQLEADARAAVQLDESKALLDTFIHLIRESGTEAERKAADYIVGRLQALGIPVTVHEPTLYISNPIRAELAITAAGLTRSLHARPPAMGRSTGDAAVEGEICYVPSKYAGGTMSLFDLPEAARAGSGDDPVRGKIVLTEGFSMPAAVGAFERRGAIGEIFIHPGRNVHEGICTSIWGAPTAESLGRKPAIPVVCINNPDGQALIADIERGQTLASIKTWLDEGWKPCPLPVVEIPGTEDPDEFLLVHGHYDSWYEGIGDNATGDAALLELARVLWGLRSRLKRSVRIAWWPGHSTGRYAGSTWYADTFADELDERCIAQLDIDSPGCEGATAYEEVMWMAEADELCRTSIQDALGLSSQRVRPLRAGDYSFNQIGPTGLYMLLSNIPLEERKRRGYYAVGGCGGNIAWHTPDDLMPVADLEIQRRDLHVYLTTIVRLLNAPLHPFDYAAAAAEMRAAVAVYHDAAKGYVDLSPVLADLYALEPALAEWRTRAKAAAGVASPSARRKLNATWRRIARLLVPLNYARGERFDHDPALKLGPVPRLEAAASIASAPETMRPFIAVGLRREVNKVRATLRAVKRELER